MLLLFLVACTAAERILSFESNEPSDAEVWTPMQTTPVDHLTLG